jgi:hypothetical protein
MTRLSPLATSQRRTVLSMDPAVTTRVPSGAQSRSRIHEL